MPSRLWLLVCALLLAPWESATSPSPVLLAAEGGPPLWPQLPADVEKSYPSLLDYEAPLKQWQHTPEQETYVRSIYLVQKRSVRLPMMETFDLPENGPVCGRREVVRIHRRN